MRTLVDSIIRLGAGLAIFIEREAGHGLISVALIMAGMVVIDAPSRTAAGHDLVVFGLGVLSRSMGTPKAEPKQ